MSAISPAFRIGSPSASAISSLVLKEMKSSSAVRMNSRSSVALCLRANESGSSPSGRSTTRTLSPSRRIMSIPRREALMPAESPS